MTTEAERGVTWPQAKDTWTHQPRGKAGRTLPCWRLEAGLLVSGWREHTLLLFEDLRVWWLVPEALSSLYKEDERPVQDVCPLGSGWATFTPHGPAPKCSLCSRAHESQ